MVGRAINILLFPIITGALSVAEFGSYSYLYSFVAVAFVMYTLRLETAYFRFEKNPSKENSHYSQSLIVIAGLSMILSGLIFVFATPIAAVLGLPLSYSPFVQMLAIILLFDAINEIPFAKLRLESRPRRFAFIKITMILVNVFIIVFLFKICPALIDAGYTGFEKIYRPEHNMAYLFGANVASSFFAFILLWSQWKSFVLELNISIIKKMLKYSLPLTIVGLAGIINETTDRIFLRKILPYDSETVYEIIGIYSGNYKIAMFIALFTQAFRYAAEPFFFQQQYKSDSNILYGKITTYYTIFTAFGFLAVGLTLPWLQDFMLDKPDYKSGYWVTPVILLANLFLGIYYNLSVWYKLTDKTHYGMVISLIGAAITIVGNIVLIPIIGYMGSAFTTLLCYAAMTVISFIMGRKHYPFAIEFPKIGFILFLTFGSYLIYEILWHHSTFDSGWWMAMRIVFFFIPLIIYAYWDREQIIQILKGKL
ncbi:oligosaccharide flippase family protein [Membranihabitans marinus]